MVSFLLLLLGCNPEYDDAFQRVDVLGVSISPPELRSDRADTLQISLALASPHKKPLQLLVWSCTPLDGQCLERFFHEDLDFSFDLSKDNFGLTPQPVSQFTSLVSTEKRIETVRFDVPAIPVEVFDVLELGTTTELALWVLACEPGECEIMNRVAANPDPQSAEYAELLAWLSDPSQWMSDLDARVYGLAASSISIGRRQQALNLQVPFITAPTSLPNLNAVGQPILISSFDIESGGNISMVASTDYGGVDLTPVINSQDGLVVQGQFELTWIRPSYTGSGAIYLQSRDSGRGVNFQFIDVSWDQSTASDDSALSQYDYYYGSPYYTDYGE